MKSDNVTTTTIMLPDDVRPLIFNIDFKGEHPNGDDLKIQIGTQVVQNGKEIHHYPITIPALSNGIATHGKIEPVGLEENDHWVIFADLKQEVNISDIQGLLENYSKHIGRYDIDRPYQDWVKIIVDLLNYGAKITYPYCCYDKTILVEFEPENCRKNQMTAYRSIDHGWDTLMFEVHDSSVEEMADELVEQILIYEELLDAKGYSYYFFCDFPPKEALFQKINNRINEILWMRQTIWSQCTVENAKKCYMLLRTVLQKYREAVTAIS